MVRGRFRQRWALVSLFWLVAQLFARLQVLLAAALGQQAEAPAVQTISRLELAQPLSRRRDWA